MTHVPWHVEDIEKSERVHGVESVELVSVGIDIGTTTTHLMVSSLLAQRDSNSYSSKFHITERETVYESPIIFTPFTDDGTIDVDEIRAFVEQSYGEAGVTPEDIDTGAVIVTGEATRKENAERLVEQLSMEAGQFVCSTAGPNLEAVMSAHGSGAIEVSLDHDVDILHIDIGGGTTKFAYVVEGIVKETASINVGARLVEIEPDNTIRRMEAAAKTVAEELGIGLRTGDRIDTEHRERLANRFAELIFEVVDGDYSPLAEELLITDVPDEVNFDAITFAGGVSEFIYDRNANEYDDLGRNLGAAVRETVTDRGFDTFTLDNGIRATVSGSTQHSVQVSGNTIHISEESRLPLRNVPIVPFIVNHDDTVEQLRRKFKERLDVYDIDTLEEPFAFGFHIHGTPTHDFLGRIIESAVAEWHAFDGTPPLILVFDSDIAMNAGRVATEHTDDVEIISLDGVELDQFGYIDIGSSLEDTGSVPLTIKSLVFEG